MDMQVDPITLYRKTAANKLQEWTISANVDVITITWGEVFGAKQTQTEFIEDGLAGRSLYEQILSRIDSRINNKIDAGYVRDPNIARRNKPVNALGLNKPMLAAKFADVKDIDYSTTWAQCKYDGHRCLIHFDGDTYTAYSRNGKHITAITEIMEAVKLSGMMPNTTLDGELYHHGTPLQTISSWVKRRQPSTTKLVYMIYDMMMLDNLHYQYRHDELSKLNLSNPLILAPTDKNITEESIPRMLDASIAAGYEGLILRRDGFSYQDGKRSKGLVKVKKWLDDEFEVIDIIESKDGYGILVCITEDSKEFRATAPGTFEDKTEVLLFRNTYIGLKVNVQFANWTKEGKPFHPIATGWRDIANE